LKTGAAYIFFLVLCFIFFKTTATAQLQVRGVVYDSTRLIVVKDVLIKSTGGNQTITDSTGRYSIFVMEKDSLIFIYNGKPTMKFPVKNIPDPGNFELALQIRLTDKYKTLKEVVVFGKTYKQDSIENRERYAKIFNFEKPGIGVSSGSPYGAGVGLDLDEFINMFRFRRNKSMRKFQERLIKEEQEKFISYRFNKNTIKGITQLSGAPLDSFMAIYRPDYEFTLQATDYEFAYYIKQCFLHYQRTGFRKGELNRRRE
jgi:hypothetical protein